MQTTIKHLRLRNFKKVTDLSIDFHPTHTTIEGANEAGKTTIFDAFTWVLFGKNSENKSDFSIKTLDSQNKAIPRLEHEVTAVFDVDGVETTFRRLYKEKYTKKRGSSVEVFDGHKEELFINDVPKSLTEYNAFVDSIFKTSISRMITDPRYFNEQLKWEQRRAILLELAGEISEQSVLIEHPELDKVQSVFDENKTVEDKKKELQAKRLRVKEQLDSVDSRLDEVNRQMNSDLRPIDVLESTLKHVESQIEQKQAAAQDKSKAVQEIEDKKTALVKQKGELERKINEDANKQKELFVTEKHKKESELFSLKSELHEQKQRVTLKQNAIEQNEQRIVELRKQFDAAREKYTEIQLQQFNVHEAKCPSCQQSLPADEIEAKKAQFNSFKATESQRLIDAANDYNGKIKKYQQHNEELKVELSEINLSAIEASIAQKQVEIDAMVMPEIKVDGAQIHEIEKQIAELDKAPIATDDNKAIIEDLNAQKTAIQSELFKHEQNQKLEARKQEILEQNAKTQTELGEIESFIDQLSKFTKYFIEKVETSINVRFEGVQFKMFEEQVNGGEKATCVCLVNGVPYPDVNTAGQINAGLAVIKTLQLHYNQLQPIFIDNRESITQILPMANQIISLIVTPGMPLTIK